mgnify:CR=1 FL=1
MLKGAALKFCALVTFFFVAYGLIGCAAPKPYKEYTLARAAIQAAEQAEAGKHASGYWHKAEQEYRAGEKHFERNENEDAREAFKSAKKFAEKAENVTRLKKFQSGAGFP